MRGAAIVLLTLRVRVARSQPRRNLTAEREEYAAGSAGLMKKFGVHKATHLVSLAVRMGLTRRE